MAGKQTRMLNAGCLRNSKTIYNQTVAFGIFEQRNQPFDGPKEVESMFAVTHGSPE
jgi:hypothetical protein